MDTEPLRRLAERSERAKARLRMRLLFILIAHLLVTLARLTGPGGVRAVAAESLAVKHQLLMMKRSQYLRFAFWKSVQPTACFVCLASKGPEPA